MLTQAASAAFFACLKFGGEFQVKKLILYIIAYMFTLVLYLFIFCWKTTLLKGTMGIYSIYSARNKHILIYTYINIQDFKEMC